MTTRGAADQEAFRPCRQERDPEALAVGDDDGLVDESRVVQWGRRVVPDALHEVGVETPANGEHGALWVREDDLRARGSAPQEVRDPHERAARSHAADEGVEAAGVALRLLEEFRTRVLLVDADVG